MKTIIINGHPREGSLNQAISEAYLKGAKEAGNDVELINLHQLKFEINLKHGYHKRIELEEDLKKTLEKIQSANHLVWVFPVWWGGFPALLKGFIDRSFLPGISYEILENKVLPKKLWKGKSGRLLITSDTPNWYFRLFLHRPVVQQMKKGVLQFCGVTPVKYTHFSPIKKSSVQFKEKILEKSYQLGLKGK